MQSYALATKWHTSKASPTLVKSTNKPSLTLSCFKTKAFPLRPQDALNALVAHENCAPDELEYNNV